MNHLAVWGPGLCLLWVSGPAVGCDILTRWFCQTKDKVEEQTWGFHMSSLLVQSGEQTYSASVDNKRSSHFSLPSSVTVDDFLKRETLEGILHYSKVPQLSWQKREQKKKLDLLYVQSDSWDSSRHACVCQLHNQAAQEQICLPQAHHQVVSARRQVANARKQIILPALAHVCSVTGSLLHTTKFVRADIPQCPNGMTKCALCERKAKSHKCQINGDGCLLLGVLGGLDAVRPRQSASVLAGLLNSQPVATHNNPSRRSEPAMGKHHNITWKRGSRWSKNNRSALFVLCPCNQRLDAKRKPFQVAILWYLSLPL